MFSRRLTVSSPIRSTPVTSTSFRRRSAACLYPKPPDAHESRMCWILSLMSCRTRGEAGSTAIVDLWGRRSLERVGGGESAGVGAESCVEVQRSLSEAWGERGKVNCKGAACLSLRVGLRPCAPTRLHNDARPIPPPRTAGTSLSRPALHLRPPPLPILQHLSLRSPNLRRVRLSPHRSLTR